MAEGGHLWMVCSLPDAIGCLGLFNLTSWRPSCDENCIVDPGEHPFVKRRSVVRYQDGRLATPTQQYKLSIVALSRPPLSLTLLAKVQEGALRSDLTAQNIQALIADSIPRQGKL